MVQDKNMVLEFDVDSQDRYGQFLAYVYVDGVLVNAELLKNGLALAYTLYLSSQCKICQLLYCFAEGSSRKEIGNLVSALT